MLVYQIIAFPDGICNRKKYRRWLFNPSAVWIFQVVEEYRTFLPADAPFRAGDPKQSFLPSMNQKFRVNSEKIVGFGY